MSSSCFSGGRTYGFDREIVKSPSTSTRTSQTSSPSSTLSESSNSRLAICTRKPRTPRKRPNQTYNEAAALLSTAYPTIFSTKHLIKNPQKLTTRPHEPFSDQSSDILLPFRVIDSPGFLLHQPIQEQSCFQIDHRPSNCYEKPCLSPAEIDSQASRASASSNLEVCESYEDDFDTESILDEEIEEGIIDSIMGISADAAADGGEMPQLGNSNSWYGNPIGLGFGGKFDFGFGVRRGVRPLRHVDEGNWWCSPTVDVLEISPRLNKPSPPPPPEKKKKKRPSATPKAAETKESDSITDNPNPAGQPLLLKLNYEEVVKEWSDRGLPFPEELADSPENNVYARIDLFTEGGGLREASVMRYKEKRRTRLFSKKIRYQVRKVNADRRPRMKGRFVRRPNSISSQR